MTRDDEYWPYSAAVAWGVWRSREAIDMAWTGANASGIPAVKLRRAETRAELLPNEELRPFDQVETEILTALSDGRVSATGMSQRYPNLGQAAIPVSFWRRARSIPTGEADRFIARDNDGPGVTPYENILLNARQLIAIYPARLEPATQPQSASTNSPIKRREKSPTQFRRYFCEYLIENHGETWPSMSLQLLIGEFLVWVRAKYGPTLAVKLGKTKPSTLSRFKADHQDFWSSLQWVKENTQR